jgi:two-component system NarL family response regulator/two-component system nitrate/nitrite response regulator NarL
MSESAVLVSVITSEPLLARGLAEVLSREPGMEIVNMQGEQGAAPDCRVADVALLDITADARPEELTGLLERARAEQVVLWAGALSSELVGLAVMSGVRGILRKQALPEEVVRCLRRVAAGELWLEARWLSVFHQAAASPLTRRERELLALLMEGRKNKEIGFLMRIGEGTVKTYLSKLFRKVGVSGRFELACYGLQHAPRDSVAGRAA